MPEQPPVNKWVVAASVMTGTIMAVLDSSIVNVALPDMRGTLGATVDEITWVVTGYILSNVIIMPIVGMLSSRFGRKNFYMVSVAMFTLASMACGLSATLGAIIVWRIVQGIGGGVLITVSQAILRETFPAEEQGLAMGIYGMGVVLAPAFGPTLGGWITDQYSWPWVFFINIPIGILNLVLVSRFIEDPVYLVRARGRIDWSGLALLTVGLGALQLMLEEGQTDNWFDSTFITWLAAIAAVGLVVFGWRELRSDTPAVDLRLFKIGAFTSATTIGGILGLGLYAALFLLPLFLQNLLGYSAMESGLVLMPRGLAMAVVMPIAGRAYNRLGPRVPGRRRAGGERLFVLGPHRSHQQRGLLGSLLAADVAGRGVRPHLRGAQHRRAGHHRKAPYDRGGGPLQCGAPGGGQRGRGALGHRTHERHVALPRRRSVGT